MRLTPILLALGLAGCGDTVVEKTVYVYRYLDAGSVADTVRSDERPPEHGEGEGSGSGEGEHPPESFDAGSPPARDVGSQSSDTNAPDAGDHDYPRIDYYNVEQRFGQPRQAQATMYDQSPVDADYVLTNAAGVDERVTVLFEEVSQRGAREGQATTGMYTGIFGGVWDEPGRYWLHIEARDRAGNAAAEDRDITVLDALVVGMYRALPDGVIYSLTYDEWQTKILQSPLFREMFNGDTGHPPKTQADVVTSYEQSLGRRIAGDGTVFDKMPQKVHLTQGDSALTLRAYYELFVEDGRQWYVNMPGFVYEDIGAQPTQALVEQALRSE